MTPEQILVLAEQVAKILAAESQGVGEVTKVASLDGVYSLPALLFSGSGDEKVVEAPLTLLRVSLRKTAEGIEWRQGDNGEWQVLIPIPDITGPQGETPMFQTGSNGIEWKYKSEADTAWRELVSIDQLKLTFDMLTESQKEAIRGYSAYQLWEQEEGNTGKTYQEFKAWMKQEALEAADTANEAARNTSIVKDDTLQVKNETKDVQFLTDKTRIQTENIKLDTIFVRESIKVTEINVSKIGIKTDTVRVETLQLQDDTKNVQITTDKARINTLEVAETTRQVKKKTKDVQNLTDKTRIKTETVQSDSLQLQEETKVILAAARQTRIDTEIVKNDTQKVQDETKAVQIATDKTRIETDTVKNDTLKVKEETFAISEIAKELNAHPSKPVDGFWYIWDLEKKEYVNSKIQAQGKTGSSFRIAGRYDTLELLKEAIPDGSGIDGVFAVGAEDPFNYFAWLVKDGLWQWDDQGQLRGAPGKTAFDVWQEQPGNADKTLADFFNFLSPYIGENKNWWIRDYDTGIKAPGTDAFSPKVDPKNKHWLVFDDAQQKYVDSGVLAEGVSVKIEIVKDTPTEYILKFISEEGEYTTPNLIGRSGSAVLDIDHVPTPEDTHYIYNGVEYAYSIGDMRRYHDTARDKFTMYFCLNLSEAGALWQKLGSGSGGGMTLISGGTAASRAGAVYKVTGGNAANTGDDDIRTGGNASEIFD